jgi:hypothetical protein
MFFVVLLRAFKYLNGIEHEMLISVLVVRILTPKGRRPFFGLFLEFGQPIVDAIFVQKISNFW